MQVTQIDQKKVMAKRSLISNQNLVLEKIPNPEDQSYDYQEVWERFALTMNGYEVCGDFEACHELMRKVLKEPLNASLTELRCTLFALQRHHRWNEYSDPEDHNVVQILRLIRVKVEKGALE